MGGLLGWEIAGASGRGRKEERVSREHVVLLGPWRMCKGTDIGAMLLPLGQLEMTCLVAGSLES